MHEIFEIALILHKICFYLDFNKQFLLNFRQVSPSINDFVLNCFPHIKLPEWDLCAFLIDQHSSKEVDLSSCVRVFCLYSTQKGVFIELCENRHKQRFLIFQTSLLQKHMNLSHKVDIDLDTISKCQYEPIIHENFTNDRIKHHLIVLFEKNINSATGAKRFTIADCTNIVHPVVYNNVGLKYANDMILNSFEHLLYQNNSTLKAIPDYCSLPFIDRENFLTILSQKTINSALAGLHDFLNNKVNSYQFTETYHGLNAYLPKKLIESRGFLGLICDHYIVQYDKGCVKIFDCLSFDEEPVLIIRNEKCSYFQYYCFELTKHHFIYGPGGSSNLYFLVDLSKKKWSEFNQTVSFFSYNATTIKLNDKTVSIIYNFGDSGNFSVMVDLEELKISEPFELKY